MNAEDDTDAETETGREDIEVDFDNNPMELLA